MRKSILLLVTIAACTPKTADQAADSSTGVAAIDTLKPAGNDTTAGRDSLAAGTPSLTAPSTPATKQATSGGTKTGTQTAQPRDTTNIGRDRAIPINTKDPKVYLPTVDTGRKRPPR